MFTLKFLGVGNAFTLPTDGDMNNCHWQSNILVTSESGKHLLLDCGSDIRFSLMQADLGFNDIDAVYVSHLHADHIGGLEGNAFTTFFTQNTDRPKLYGHESVVIPLWDNALKGGLDSIEGQLMTLTGYFDLRAIRDNGHFVWEGIRFDLIQVIHVMAERIIKHSFGLMIYEDGTNKPKIFWTSDTQHCPSQIGTFYAQADIILHDCETSQFPSGVHAHYNDLNKDLPNEVKEKTWLYHYNPDALDKFFPEGDGFCGFIKKGDVFTVKDEYIFMPRSAEPFSVI